MNRYYLSEEDKAPIRAKDMQPLLAVGLGANVLRTICQAIDIPPINLSPRMGGSQRLEELQRQLIASSGRPQSQEQKAEQLTPDEIHKRKRVKEIEAELKLADPMARIRR
jgi:hypothetical protein